MLVTYTPELEITDGPAITLPAGHYRLQWSIESDGENEISFSSSNYAKIEPNLFTTSPEEYEGDVTFDILEPVYHLSFNICTCSGTETTVHSLRISSPFYTDRIFLVCIFAILITIFTIALRHGLLKKEHLSLDFCNRYH